ncbi:MAG: hypothetical protein M1158_04380 [Candidatus Marsarchaeota archaeon]|nr:hypothetical protein [Candidatus Marsarchaeota archaeon]
MRAQLSASILAELAMALAVALFAMWGMHLAIVPLHAAYASISNASNASHAAINSSIAPYGLFGIAT